MARNKAIGAGAVVTSLLLLTACSSTDSDAAASGESSSTAEPIVAAADASLLPYNFLADDNETFEGINVDLAAALSEELGREIVFENASFDTIIPGLTSGRYDVALTGMFDTLEREETVDFVDYLAAKNDFLVPMDVSGIESMDDLCGYSVGIPGGALEADMLAEASTACEDAGEEPIEVNEYADLDAVVLALTSGRIEVAPNDSAANAYIMSQYPDELQVMGAYLTDGYFAAGFAKDSELVQEFNDAFAAIMEDGTYEEILSEWGIDDRALDEPIINGATF
ncbi:ABC transporter substrate-binding protein [Demequina sp. NBRC 110054]|uniref:ABC transporter substrate-binding protein n=1 Tax=Demequina sp. NBRC 110054 TaxID=1570343 RepID=UPI00135629AB|nr:ABC transporter substrate-binding protein [Demequina sp. NBRC 110054]